MLGKVFACTVRQQGTRDTGQVGSKDEDRTKKSVARNGRRGRARGGIKLTVGYLPRRDRIPGQRRGLCVRVRVVVDVMTMRGAQPESAC